MKECFIDFEEYLSKTAMNSITKAVILLLVFQGIEYSMAENCVNPSMIIGCAYVRHGIGMDNYDSEPNIEAKCCADIYAKCFLEVIVIIVSINCITFLHDFHS